MIRPYAISALATVIVSIMAVSVINPGPAPQGKQFGSSHGRLYQLSPIPAGADWGRS